MKVSLKNSHVYVALILVLGIRVCTPHVAQSEDTTNPTNTAEPYDLAALLSEAATNNFELKAFAEAVASAKGQIVTAHTWENPEFTLGPALKHIPSTEIDSGERFYKGSYELSQSILFPGKRALQVAIAERELKASELALRGMSYQVSFKVSKAFYALLAAEELRKLRAEQVKSAKVFAEASRKRSASGYGSDFEVVKGEAELIAAEKLLREAEVRAISTRGTLNTLIGRSPEITLEVRGDLHGFKPSVLNSDLVDIALSQNPAYKSQLFRVERAGLSVKASRLSRIPDIRVGPFVEYAKDEHIFGVGVSIPLPLWDLKGGAIASANAEQRKIIAETEKLRLEIVEAVTTARASFSSRRDQAALYSREFLDRLKGLMERAEKSYASNATTLLLYLDARRTYFDSMADYYDTVSELTGSYAELQSAVGVPLDGD